MKRGHVLRILVNGGTNNVFLQIGDEQIPAETAVKVWEALEVNVPSDQPSEIPVEKKQEKKQPKRRPLDDGKILALRTAGWSLQKIADEMNVSQQTIANHLDAMKEKA